MFVCLSINYLPIKACSITWSLHLLRGKRTQLRKSSVWRTSSDISAGTNAYRTAFGNKESHADLAMRSAYELRSIEHILKHRRGPQAHLVRLSAHSFGNLVTGDAHSHPPYSHPMPLLTLRGFIDSTALDVLTSLEQGWTYLNRALRYYRIPIWREKGDIPREMIPTAIPPAIQARQAQIQQNSMKLSHQLQKG